MTLLLTLEHAPQPQAVRQMRLEAGELVIGRSAEADWQIDDPDLFVSRAHCTISGGPEAYVATDTSTGGLFVDDERTPVGTGNSRPIRNGMRLRLGDYVLRAEIRRPEERAPPPARQAELGPEARQARTPAGFAEDSFFSGAGAAAFTPPPPRPSSLPDPFERPAPGAYRSADRDGGRPASLAFDDPFTLDPPSSPPPPAAAPAGFDAPFAAPPRAAPAPAGPPAATPPAAASDAEMRNAFLRGLGLSPADLGDRDPLARMEAFGREYRMMLEGLMHLLRKRAEEKNNARLGQTVIGAREVNPLKFLPTVDAALATMAADRSPGFLPADAAIAEAVRDLARHHVGAWRGVQGALARMIERFDPEALERELKNRSALETIMAGGRRAKLWELYEQRYREIARSAEARFLGEVGADFRDAYEKEGD